MSELVMNSIVLSPSSSYT